jgi:uncharacterized membrane protein YjgN (DUF898 family)
MSETAAETRVGRVEFTGSRHELLNIILAGYALMLPTIGLYRFWQATWKRRFYWQNTIIDGEPLEYTGRASQLLLGFLFALAFFLPVYIALFYFSMQDSDLVLIGYAVIGAVFWFLMGYGIYRARDFRLSRTLWRGIRFDLKGNAWAYALRRFLWSILLVATIGLVYPWMASSLWKYRWRNTWLGDHKFEIAGNWRVFAGPYFAAYLVNAFTIGATAIGIPATHDFMLVGNTVIPGPVGLLACFGCLVLLTMSYCWYRTRTVSAMLSTISLGAAKLNVRVTAGRLFVLYVGYLIGVVVLLVVLAAAAIVTVGGIYAAASGGGKEAVSAHQLATMFQSGTLNVALLILVYLVVLGAFGLLSEIILRFGWWKLLAGGTTITNPDALSAVRAGGEDRSLIGQGLADALNVGAY